jgi:Leucine-rich repeat (LRR) protein/DNA-directed RNA polymerase subunit RPC12/RpoP
MGNVLNEKAIKKLQVKCIFCDKKFKKKDLFTDCPYPNCYGRGHEHEFIEWVKTQANCPTCKKPLQIAKVNGENQVSNLHKDSPCMVCGNFLYLDEPSLSCPICLKEGHALELRELSGNQNPCPHCQNTLELDDQGNLIGTLCFICNQRFDNASIDKISRCPYCGISIHTREFQSHLKQLNNCPKCSQPLRFYRDRFDYVLTNRHTTQCAICEDFPFLTEDLSSCPFCKVVAHKIHFQEWIQSHQTCPKCEKSLVLDDLGFPFNPDLAHLSRDEQILWRMEQIIGSIPRLQKAVTQDSCFGVVFKDGQLIALSVPIYHYKPALNPFIVGLNHLKLLNLVGSKIRTLPDSFGTLTNLEILSLERCGLKEFPACLRHLKNLKSLNLYVNDLSNIPDYIDKLESLEEMVLMRNKITTLPKTIGNLRHLKRIDLATLPIDHLPISFGTLQLENLSLYKCNLREIPECIYNLKNLQKLWLQENQLTTISEKIGNLTELRQLHLNNNQLSTLPESIGNLTALNSFSIADNQFTQIPTHLWSLKNLGFFNVKNNPLSQEEAFLALKTADVIIEYLRKKTTINIFISHTVADFEPYQLKKLANFLSQQKTIAKVFICEEDLIGNIDEWMVESVPKAQLVLFLATQNSVYHSRDCRFELDLANQFSIPVLPIKGFDVEWKDVLMLNLSQEFGLTFYKDRFEEFCAKLNLFITDLRQEIDLLDEEERSLGLSKAYHSFQVMYAELETRFTSKLQDLQNRINNLQEK